jgi:hypothetical protein
MRPAIARAVFEHVERIERRRVAQMIGAHVRGMEPGPDEAEADGIAKAGGEEALLRSVGLISTTVARIGSFSSQALQLLPTET